MDLTQEEYVKDPRIACNSGSKCAQKRVAHHKKYKHPPRTPQGDDAEIPSKKPRVDQEAASVKRGRRTGEGVGSKVKSNKILKDFDKKEFIKSKLLVEMPDDFYKFWDFCKGLNSKNPLLALKAVGLTLVGPFDVLAGKFDNTIEQSNEKYLLHWRFFYDPPEFQTVLVGNTSGYHVGYFRDEPTKLPAFLAENYADKDGTFSIIGGNIFAAVHSYLDDLLKTTSKKTSIQRFTTLIKKEAEKLNFDLSKRSTSVVERESNIVAHPFNTLGMVVPYNRYVCAASGYRPLVLSNEELKVEFEKLSKASGAEREELLSDFQYVLLNASIATDECDFGTGLELGLDMLFYGIDHLNVLTKQYLCNSYNLLNRSEFAQIAEAHVDNRKKGSNLSII